MTVISFKWFNMVKWNCISLLELKILQEDKKKWQLTQQLKTTGVDDYIGLHNNGQGVKSEAVVIHLGDWVKFVRSGIPMVA